MSLISFSFASNFVLHSFKLLESPYNSLLRHRNSADYLIGKPAEILNENLLQHLKEEPIEEELVEQNH